MFADTATKKVGKCQAYGMAVHVVPGDSLAVYVLLRARTALCVSVVDVTGGKHSQGVRETWHCHH